MSPTLGELGIDLMSTDERLLLAQEILESVRVEQPVSTLTPAKWEELRRRVADHIANPNDVVSWEEIQADLAKKHGW